MISVGMPIRMTINRPWEITAIYVPVKSEPETLRPVSENDTPHDQLKNYIDEVNQRR